jgi:hypothetical protein
MGTRTDRTLKRRWAAEKSGDAPTGAHTPTPRHTPQGNKSPARHAGIVLARDRSRKWSLHNWETDQLS